MKSSLAVEFEVEAMYCYSIYDMPQLVVGFHPFPIDYRCNPRLEI
jgi:CDP-glycerol glycerophosphotransferase (TagB/SpsB family)